MCFICTCELLHHAITVKTTKYSTKYDTGVIRVVIFFNSAACIKGVVRSEKIQQINRIFMVMTDKVCFFQKNIDAG